MSEQGIKEVPVEIKKLPSLWGHQKEAINKAGMRFALFFDPGCGKTRTAIELYKKALFRSHITISSKDTEAAPLYPPPGKAIIFAPLNVCRNWQNELKMYLQEEHEVFLVAGQTKEKKLRTLKEFAAYVQGKDKGVAFLICNIECLRNAQYITALAKCNAKFIIVDESHNFKSASAKQTKGLMELDGLLKPTHMYLLSGTPAPQGEIDLWSTFTLLKKNKDNFYIWRKKNFVDKNERRRGMNNYWPEYVIAPKAREEMQKMLGECSIVAKKNEVLDLPPLLRTNVYADMSIEQKRHYKTMEEFLFAIDEDGEELNASNVLVRTLRLQQILAGFIGHKSLLENPRLRALDTAIEMTQGEQFIIWTIFQATYKQLGAMLEKLGISYGFLTGEQPPEERHENIEWFQDGTLKCLIAHPRAGGVGVNLTKASYSIHYTRSFSLTDDLQCEARNYRGGSEIHERITRIDIITPDTIDEDILEALREKKSMQDFILGLKENGRKY